MIGMTKRHYDLLTFITDHTDATDGVAPSFDEMKNALGLRSKSGIHRMVCALEERGYIRRLPNRKRAIEVVAHPGRKVTIAPRLWSSLKEWAGERHVTIDEASATLLKLALHLARKTPGGTVTVRSEATGEALA